MLKGRWAGVVDTVGGNILATAIKSTKDERVCRLLWQCHVSGSCVSVFPFILRGVSLLGVDSVEIPIGERQLAWHKLAGEWSSICPATCVGMLVGRVEPEDR